MAWRVEHLRVLGIASAAFPPGHWDDDDHHPELAAPSGLAVCSEELWLAGFWPEPD